MNEYDNYSLEEQLDVFKQYLPRLPEILDQLQKFNDRDEKLTIEHDVNVDLTDVKGEVKVINKLDVNDIDTLLTEVKKTNQILNEVEFDPTVDVKAPIVNMDLKKLETVLQALADKDVVVNVKENSVKLPTRAQDAIAVKLVDPDGKQFYRAQSTGGGGGIGKLAELNIVGGAMPITGTINATPSTLADFSANDIDVTSGYYGMTKPDGTWLVLKKTEALVSYATVSNNGAVTTYTNAWTNKLTLTYGRFDEAF